MTDKELTKSQDFDREDLVLSLKERILKKGLFIFPSKGEIKGDNGIYYQSVKEFCKLSSEKALLWLWISYKRDLSGRDLWDIKVSVDGLWARSNVFIPVKLGAKHKEELALLIRAHVKIDKSAKGEILNEL